jgi:hypothetical protein
VSIIRENKEKSFQVLSALERPFSLWSPRTVSLFGQVPKREMGLDLRSLPLANRQEKTDCHGSVRTASQ